MKNPSSFLQAPPLEIEEIIDWSRHPTKAPVPEKMNEFSEGFLYAIGYDGAYFPIVDGWEFAQLLAFVLTHHEMDPNSPLAWMNLGFAYRRMALHDVSHSSRIRNQRQDLAFESFARSLKIDSQN